MMGPWRKLWNHPRRLWGQHRIRLSTEEIDQALDSRREGC